MAYVAISKTRAEHVRTILSRRGNHHLSATWVRQQESDSWGLGNGFQAATEGADELTVRHRYNQAMSAPGDLIRPDTTALVVVDLQQKLTPVIEGIDAVLENTKKLLQLARILSLPTLATTQYRCPI